MVRGASKNDSCAIVRIWDVERASGLDGAEEDAQYRPPKAERQVEDQRGVRPLRTDIHVRNAHEHEGKDQLGGQGGGSFIVHLKTSKWGGVAGSTGYDADGIWKGVHAC